jgi:hypothetical protein
VTYSVLGIENQLIRGGQNGVDKIGKNPRFLGLSRFREKVDFGDFIVLSKNSGVFQSKLAQKIS